MARNWIGIALLAGALQACGDRAAAPGEEETTASALLADNCSTSDVDWPAGFSDAQRVCEGSWEYGAACCTTGEVPPLSCKHTHKLADYTASYAQAGTCTQRWICEYTCLAPTPASPRTTEQPVDPCPKLCEYVTVCTYPACTASSTGAINAAITAANNVRAGCALPAGAAPVAFKAITSGSTNNQYCRVTVTNAAYSNDGLRGNVCETTPDRPICGETPAPKIYGACTGATTNPDGSPQVQVSSTYCGGRAYSPVGKSLAWMKDPANVNSAQQVDMKCLTCEDRFPLGSPPTALQVRAKYTCLSDELAANRPIADAAGHRLAVVRNIKELFEFYGHLLDANQQTQAQGLYASEPSAVPACTSASPWTPPTTTGCIKPASLDGRMRLCDRLNQQHTSLEVVGLAVGTCIDALADMKTMQACSLQDYLNAFMPRAGEALRRGFTALSATAPAERQAALQSRLKAIDRWYTGLRGLEPQLDLWRDTSNAAAALLQGAHANDTIRLEGTTERTTADQIFRDAWLVDAEVIKAATSNTATGGPPLTSAPLLFVVANALRPTLDRMDDAAPLHDLSCRFRSCTSAGPDGKQHGIPTPLTKMFTLVGALPHKTAATDPSQPTLSAALNAAPELPAAWREAFGLLESTHATVFQAAAKDALNSTLYDADEFRATVDVNNPVHALGEIVGTAQIRARNYENTGRLRPGEANALYTGLTQSKLVEVNGLVAGAKEALRQQRLEFDASWRTFVGDQLRLGDATLALTNLQTELFIQSLQLQEVGERVEGLRKAASIDQSRFGDFSAAYRRMVEKLEDSGSGRGTYLNAQSPGAIDIAPSNQAHRVYQGPGAPSVISQVAVSDAKAKITAAKDDLVQISASGQWSTVCALRETAGAFRPALNVPLGSLTGAHGYEVSYSTSGYSAVGKEKVKDGMEGVRAVGYIGAGIASIVTGGAALAAFAAVDQGINMFKGIFGSTSKKKSSGTENRTTASFSVGLRSTAAPFPEYPAGALLAVKLPQGATILSQIVDVEVVNAPNTSLVIDRPTDVYLVVNDKFCANNPDDGKLNVTLSKLTPLAGVAKQVQPAMASAYAYIQGQVKDKIVPQGMLLGTDLTSLRTQAMNELYAACGYCDLRGLEQSALQFFETWLEAALNQAERQITLNKMERDLSIATARWENLAAQLEQRQRQSQLAQLMPVWDALGLEDTKFRDDTLYLARLVDRYMYPFLSVKYPEALSGLGVQSPFLALTQTLDWNASWVQQARSAEDAVDLVLQKLLEARAAYDLTVVNGTQTERPPEYVMLAIPKPIEMVEPDQRKILTGVTWVSDLPFASEVVGWAPARKDLSVVGNPIRLNGVAYSKGIGTHSRADQTNGVFSEVSVDIAGRGFRYFQADVGVDDEVIPTPNCGSVTFEVWADGTRLYASGLVKPGNPARFVSVAVDGRSRLTLRVTNGDGADWCDHADWAEARLTSQTPLIDLYYAAGYSSGTYRAPFRELPGSAEIWRAIAANQPVNLTVTPEDIFQADAAVPQYGGQLKCYWSVPVIRSIEVYSANDGGSYVSALNAGRSVNKVTLQAGEQQSYVGHGGQAILQGRNDAWFVFAAQPRYGLIGNAVPNPAAPLPGLVTTGAGMGLSAALQLGIPPGQRDKLDPAFDLAGIQHRHTSALVLLLELEVRYPGTSRSWLEACP